VLRPLKSQVERRRKQGSFSFFFYYYWCHIIFSLTPSHSLLHFFFYHHSPFLCNTQQANLGWSQWTARQNRQAYPWAARGASVVRSADGFLTFPLRFPSASGFVALHTIIFVLLTNILLYYNNNIIYKKSSYFEWPCNS